MKNNSINIHFIGVGGIGMSGLAQMYKCLGFTVTGSDRGYGKSENSSIFAPLENQNIMIYPQNGEFFTHFKNNNKLTKCIIVYSTAIENDNPDMMIANDHNLAKMHRSEALSQAISLKNHADESNNVTAIAIAGSCGKTTVCSYAAEMLQLLTKKCSFLSGGIVNRFASDNSVGNYFSAENAEYFIFEADESDKSIINYHVDYAIILNAEDDHYSRDELLEVFKKFIGNIRYGVVIEHDLAAEFPQELFKNINLRTFSTTNKNADFFVADYAAKHGEYSTQITAKNSSQKIPKIKMVNPGLHNASNICSIIALFSLLGTNLTVASDYFKQLKGAWRRFNLQGKLDSGAKVFDDYAHNVSKIKSCLKAAREARGTETAKVFLIFQPHGFGPLKIMEQQLLAMLHNELKEDEYCYFLPVYYAGGTTSFKPTSEEVITNYHIRNTNAKNIYYIPTRDEVKSLLDCNSSNNDIVVIAGARDNSLATWSKEICQK